MAPYNPPTSGRAGKLRLDFNENTVGCSPRVTEFLKAHISAETAAVYPDYAEVKEELAAHFGVAENEMLLTNGTDEAIQVLINSFVDQGDDIIILRPSYAMYQFYAELAGAKIRQISYRDNSLEFPLEELLDAINPTTRAVLISNPNNPTGTAVSVDGILSVLQQAPNATVLIDEAYYEFCGKTTLPLIREYPNLFVSRTFSKAYGMASLRLGCLFSDARHIAVVHNAQSPYSVNTLAAHAAREAVRDSAYINNYVAEVLAARDQLYNGLRALRIPYFQSEGNFVLVRFGDRAAEVCDKLRAAGLLVRDRSHDIAGCIRVTVGTHEQMSRFLTELERVWR
jgi:histidinol-phosphate aminotransferase